MDLMLLVFIVVILGGTTALCIWAAKVGKRNQEKRFNRKYGSIVKAEYLGSVKRVGISGLEGAAVGCLVGGILGILTGALIPSDKQKHRFAVKYSDGSVKIREVSAGTAEYNRLVSLTNLDDI